jgi:hypothetical protein
MINTDHASDRPSAVFLPPNMDELCLAHDAVVLLPWVKEAVNSDLDRTIALQRINFERSRYQLPLYFSAKIVLDGIDDLLAACEQAVLVVVELCIVGPERCLSFHVTTVDCIEKLLIELRDGLKERVCCGDLVAGRRGMRGIRLRQRASRQRKQRDDHETTGNSGFQTGLLRIEWSNVQ